MSNATARLLDLASGFELWATPCGEAFATFRNGDHSENWPLRSAPCRLHLSALFYHAEKASPSREATDATLATLEGRALHEGERHAAHLRVARDGEALYVDLGDSEWSAVEIGLTGWRVIRSEECPVRFRRSKAMRPLPLPARGGSLDELRPFVNVGGDADFVLLVAWLIGALRPSGPYPVLCLHGEQGCGKSQTARLLRALIDPNVAPIRAEPHEVRDLMVTAQHSWVAAFDNLSGVRPWLSDALCRLATGGGYAARSLYTDAEETILDATRPVILTGIGELATRGDLLERSILLTLPRIPDGARSTEADLWGRFHEAAPRILGALLGAVARALRDESQTRVQRLPRMADFARWVVAAEPACPWRPGDFLAACRGNRDAANEAALEACPVAEAVLRLMSDRTAWEGTATELLRELARWAHATDAGRREWPRGPLALSIQLRRVGPNLRGAGVNVEFDQRTAGSGSRRLIRLRREGGDGIDATDASGAPAAPKALCVPCDACDANAPASRGDAAPAADGVQARS